MSLFERIKTKAENAFTQKEGAEHQRNAGVEGRLREEFRRMKAESPEDYQKLVKHERFIQKDFKIFHSAMNAGERKAANAYAKLYLSEDMMTVFLLIFPPLFGGKDITESVIREDLLLEGVEYGIDHELLRQTVEQKDYLSILVIARGTLPVDGQDGRIEDCVARRESVDMHVGENHIADFEKMALFCRIRKGEAICRIIPAEPGRPGRNVIGRELPAKSGIPAEIPQGKHTVLSRDQTVLLAEVSGDISVEGGLFNVDNRLLIEGDLDASSEKLEYPGDIIIAGNVADSVAIHAKGSVLIGGLVGAATIHAGVLIYIQKGMNGNSHGVLDCRGEIQCRLLENTKVVAKGNIYADAISKCDVYSKSGSVYVKGGKGLLAGGLIRASKSVEAKRIGNQSLTLNTIFIGYDPEKNEKLNSLNKELGRMEETLAMIRRGLKELGNVSKLSQEKKVTYRKLRQQEELYLKEKEELLAKIQCTQEGNRIFNEASLTAETIFPITIVNFMDKKMTIKERMEHCRITDKGGVLGMVRY